MTTVLCIVFSLFVPVLMIVCGYFMYKHPPKDINSVIGYRTSASMKNSETWAFAHYFCGRLWVKSGIVSAAVSALFCILYFFLDDKTSVLLMCIIELLQVLLICYTIIPTEQALKRNFDEEGNRKDNT